MRKGRKGREGIGNGGMGWDGNGLVQSKADSDLAVSKPRIYCAAQVRPIALDASDDGG